MLFKARYRILFYIILLISAYVSLEILIATGSISDQRVVLNSLLSVNSVDTSQYRIIDQVTERQDGEFVVAEIVLIVDERSIFIDDLWSYGSRIKVGVRVEAEVTVREFVDLDRLSINFDEFQSPEFIQGRLVAESKVNELTPTMRKIIFENDALVADITSYPRTLAVFLAQLFWILGWVALIVEGIYALVRAHRHEYRYYEDLCHSCDYQLTRDLTRCPECGQPVNWRSYKPKKRT